MAVTVVVLSGLTFGHWISGRLTDAPRINPSKALAVALGLAAVLNLAAIPLLRSVSGVVLARCGPVWGVFAITTLVCFLPSLLSAV